MPSINIVRFIAIPQTRTAEDDARIVDLLRQRLTPSVVIAAYSRVKRLGNGRNYGCGFVHHSDAAQ
jgi:hypothetical protein